MRNTNTTIVDFYQGAYGPTIRIDVQEIAWLKSFKSLIVKLKNKSIPEVELLRIAGVEKEEISGLKIVLGTYTSLSLIPPAQSEKYASFFWTVTIEDAIYMIGAVDRLLKSDEPGHYYFYDQDGFLIELAFKE